VPDVHAAPYIQLAYYILGGTLAFVSLVGVVSAAVFFILRSRFDDIYAKKSEAEKEYLTRSKADDRYMTHEQFAQWADEHKRWGFEVIEGLKSATSALNRTLEKTNERLDTLDTRLYDVLQRVVGGSK